MKLSDKEWRVLNALWVAPEGLALGAVVDALRPDTGWSRSTVLTSPAWRPRAWWTSARRTSPTATGRR